MKSAADLMARLGGNMRESMGTVKTPEGATPAPALHGGAPTKYAGATRIKDALSIELDRIIPDPNQPRKEFEPEALAELAASLKAKGQLQAILVRWDEASGRWMVVAGERRYRAAALAGMSTLTCIELKGELAQEDLLELQLVENALRSDLKPIEQANAYKALLDCRRWSHRQLADNLSIAASSVARALALLELPADVQEKVTAGTLAPSVAYEVARLEDPEQQREVAALVVQNDLSRAEAVEHVRRVAKAPKKGRGGAKAGPPRPRTFRLAGGKAIIEPRKVGGLEAMLAMVREMAEILEGEIGARSQDAA